MAMQRLACDMKETFLNPFGSQRYLLLRFPVMFTLLDPLEHDAKRRRPAKEIIR
jgi:hypothetical protein